MSKIFCTFAAGLGKMYVFYDLVERNEIAT